jgi:DNA-binding MarR family transcriptional regulator
MKKPSPSHTFYRSENYQPEDSVGYLMRQIIHKVGQEVDRQLAHTELTDAQWKPLYKLSMGQASTVADLARQCTLDAGAMTRMLDRLEAKGLCKRVRSESDRRVVNIELTPVGKQAADQIPRILCGVQNAHLAGFTEEEFHTLREYLRRILTNAESIADLAHDNPHYGTDTNAAH